VQDETSHWVPVIAAPAGLALAVVEGGVNVPSTQLTLAQPVEQPIYQEAPVVERTGPTAAEREEAVRKARVPVVYPRKQARN
jgi:hypothetical protein